MTAPLTSEQAIALLREHPEAYKTPDKLLALVEQVDADAPGHVTVLYSGPSAKGVWSSDIISSMIEANEDIRVIDRSEASRFLKSRDFYHSLAGAFGLDDFRSLEQGNYRGPATEWLYHSTEGPWAKVSARFADATVGEVRAIVGDALPDRVFGATEVPHTLANRRVSTIEGIPRETLVARQATHGSQAAFEMIAASSREHVASLRVAADTPVNFDGKLLRDDLGQLRLDSRDYFAATQLEGKAPAFASETHPLIGSMSPPTEHVRAGQLHFQELQMQSLQAHRPRVGTTLAKGLGAVGVAATAYDALITASRAVELREQGSLLASQSQLNHFAARNVGAWAGAAAGAAVGWETGPGVVAFAAVGAIATSAAGERIADWWDQQKIYRQTDRDGVDWKFNGRQWLRQQQADLVNDGVDAPQRQAFAALPDKANELNYRATLAAADLAAGAAPEPKDPYRLPATESDRPSLRAADWRHDPVTGEWHRNVATGLNSHNDRPIYTPETASPQRAAQLDRQAAAVIAENIANGPAARAARVDQAYRANNWQEYGPLPENLRAALSDTDTLTASDGKQYRRGADGNWSHDEHVAEGNRKLELEATRAALQPALAQHAEAMAAVHARAPLSPQEQERVNLATTYASFGIRPNADTMQAALLAVQRTRELHGIDAAATSLAPQPSENGGYNVEGALGHLRTDANGVVHMAAVTSSEDIRNALDEIRHRGIEGRDSPNPAPETTIGSRSAGGRESRGTQVLADNPAHPDFATFNRIHTWVRGTGQWDEEKSRNVASALYREQAGDPLVKRVDKVVGGMGRNGAENVFAVYAPFGDKEPFFHVSVDGRGASQLPAQQSLEQAEQAKQQHLQHQQQDQAMQQDRQAQRVAQLSM